jgi:mycofactocin system glycosyltransferase
VCAPEQASVVLDPRARVLDGGRTLLGGDPWRVLRLTERGAATLRELLASTDSGEAAAALARRLIDAGLAHPRPACAPTDTVTSEVAAAPTAEVAAAVTVVIPVRDRAAALARCLSALLATDPPGRVLIVDDGSRDPDAVVALCARHGCELVRRERPGGPAAARNTALARVGLGPDPASGAPALVALLDSDCVPEPGWLALLCGVLAADARLGAVAPRVRPLATAPAGDALARFAAARSPLDLGRWPSLVRPGGRTAYLPAATLLVRREALAEAGAPGAAGAGPFDPALRYGEDVDLVWRMIERGWSVRYVPEAIVRHEEPGRLGPWLARRFRYGSAAGPLARRHPALLAPVALHPRSVAVLTAVALALAGGPPPRGRGPAGSRVLAPDGPRTRHRARARAHVPAAAAPLAVHVALSARGLARHGVPPRTGAALALRGLGESGAALGRAVTMLAAAPLVAGLTHRRTRGIGLVLLLAAPVRDLVRLRPPLDPLRFTALSIADDVAYGAGVWAGALRARTLRPLRPRIVRAERRVSSQGC